MMKLRIRIISISRRRPLQTADQVEEQPDGTIGYKTVYGESDVEV